MSLSDRDRKLALIIVPIVVLVAYWFLLFSPKREEAATAASDLSVQTERRDSAKATVDQAASSKTDFAADYGEIVRLGKAIPAQVDMPSLMLQLNGAAEGTGIKFTGITAGERVVPEVVTPPDASAGSEPPVAAGGEQAASAPGGATEAANDTAQTSNQQADAASQSGVSSSDAQTSTSTKEGGLPVGGGAATGGAVDATAPAGLETVPLELDFTGDFFHLADFFHRVKRFVHVMNNNVVVNGRLVTIETVNYSSDTDLFPKIKATLTATVYLAPKSQGATAGATPLGPDATTPAADGSTPAPSPTSTPAPTAAVTP